jgi:alpha-glucosidase (family GH31 glycosyl hydrolase)
MGDPGPLVRQETPGYQPDPNELHDAAIEPICKKYLELRQQLMPYLYAAVKETCETGAPIIRALWLHYPDDAVAVARGDEYLYGREILVAPVVEKSATTRSLYLPRGTWYDFWTKQRLEGGREIVLKVDLETIPLYVRAGAVIPMGPIKQYTAENVAAPLALWVYPGQDGAFFALRRRWQELRLSQGRIYPRPVRVERSQTAIERATGHRFENAGIVHNELRRACSRRIGDREFVFQARPVEVKL